MRSPGHATPLHPRQQAVIVGASSGIGAALARQLARQGVSVALIARRADRLEELCEEINAQAGELRARAYPHDVRDHAQVPDLLQKIIADLGGMDLFIYAAGISLPTGIRQFDFDQDLLTTQVNYLGALAWLDPVARLFQSCATGTIVGISSVAGDRGRIGAPAYGASKAALTSLLESLRNRLTRLGVHVLTVKPGFVATEMTRDQKGLFWVIPAEQAAADICKAIRRRQQVVYVPARWRLVMLVVRHIPSFLFRRLSF